MCPPLTTPTNETELSDPVCQRMLFFISAFHIHFSLTLSVYNSHNSLSIQMVVLYYNYTIMHEIYTISDFQVFVPCCHHLLMEEFPQDKTQKKVMWLDIPVILASN